MRKIRGNTVGTPMSVKRIAERIGDEVLFVTCAYDYMLDVDFNTILDAFLANKAVLLRSYIKGKNAILPCSRYENDQLIFAGWDGENIVEVEVGRHSGVEYREIPIGGNDDGFQYTVKSSVSEPTVFDFGDFEGQIWKVVTLEEVAQDDFVPISVDSVFVYLGTIEGEAFWYKLSDGYSLTEADKAEMVQAVIAALPTYNGEVEAV